MVKMVKQIKKYYRKMKFSDVLSYSYILGISTSTGLWGKIQSFKLRLLGVKIGRGFRCYGGFHVIRFPLSRVLIGSNVLIVSSTKRSGAASLHATTRLKTLSTKATIIIEDEVSLNGTSITARAKTIIVGAGTIIAPNCVIMDSDFHELWPPENRLTNPGFARDADVHIGKNVWIGTQSIILKGVSIGDNSVIGAGSIVSRDIPSNVLAAGVPARVIKSLDCDDRAGNIYR